MYLTVVIPCTFIAGIFEQVIVNIHISASTV